MNTPEPTSVNGQSQSGTVITIHLRNIPLLNGVDEATLQQIAGGFQVRAYGKGIHVIHKGTVGEHLIFLILGRLQVVDVTEDGKEVGLSFLAPGDYFGELSIIDGEARSASVVTCEDSLLAFLPRSHALKLIYGTPLVAERVIRRLASSLRKASAQRTIMAIPNAFGRVFAVLHQFVTVAPGGLVVIEKMPTQQELAIMANTSRETVSRAIQSLIQKGVVEKDIRRLIIRRPEALQKAASGLEGEGGDR